MKRDHSEHHHHHHHSGAIGTAFFLNLFFTIIEIAGGIYTNSTAILADAVHDLGDSFTLGLSWYFERVSGKGRDERYSYGYRRFSLLGGLVSAIVLIGGSIIVLTEAIPRLLHPEETNPKGMVVFAIIGIVVNGAAVLRLKSGSSINARVVMLHLLEDVLGWAAVLAGSIIMLCRPLYIIDPILCIVITGYVLFNVVKSVRAILQVFLQAVPDKLDVADIERKLSALDGVVACHHTHTWSMDGEHHALSTHLVIPASADKDGVIAARTCAKALLKSLHFSHYTIEVEFEDEECAAH